MSESENYFYNEYLICGHQNNLGLKKKDGTPLRTTGICPKQFEEPYLCAKSDEDNIVKIQIVSTLPGTEETNSQIEQGDEESDESYKLKLKNRKKQFVEDN